MSNGYKIRWTHRAQNELQSAYDYLHENWTIQVIRKLSRQVENLLVLIADNPKLFPFSAKTNRHRAVVNKHYVLTYRIEEQTKTIYILAFSNTRQHPNKL